MHVISRFQRVIQSCKSGSMKTGIDTLGDVRLPAACCGILGFRASHGAVSTVGVLPVAQSFDAVGM